MNRRLRLLLTILPVLAILSGCQEPTADSASLEVAHLLGESADAERYERARTVREFHFPADHGPHPGFRNEWWYLTGHLRDEQKRLFGYQLTFFRIALAPEMPASASAWATNQLWMVHAALTDVQGGEHTAVERLARDALNLAGGKSDAVAVWLGDWQLRLVEDDEWMLKVNAEEFSLSLRLDSLKPVVLQGERGLSRKSPAPGNASYYYSQTRLDSGGTLTLGRKTFKVSGLSWLDREWSTSALAPDQVGWDWFSLQVEGNRELMFYRLRTTEGGLHDNSQGVWVTESGDSRRIFPDDLVLTPVEYWQSAAGRRYPVVWDLQYPQAEVNWRIRAVLPNQEMDLVVSYWEGLIEVIDDKNRVIGHGYLEMTGY